MQGPIVTVPYSYVFKAVSKAFYDWWGKKESSIKSLKGCTTCI